MKFPLFAFGLRSKSPHVTVEERINCYVDKQQAEDRAAYAIYRTPGLELLQSIGTLPSRGMYVSPSNEAILYTVHGTTLYEVTLGGIATAIGTLTTETSPVDFADNGVAGHQIILADGPNAYVWDTLTRVFETATFADGTALGASSIAYQDTYFIASIAGTNRIQVSAPYDGGALAWAVLDFVSAQTAAGPLTGVLAHGGVLYLVGATYIEFWSTTTDPSFPFARIFGAGLDLGAVFASLAVTGDGIFGLFRSPGSRAYIGLLFGTAVKRISTPELEALLATYTTTADAIGYAYSLHGHPMYQVSFPGADATWLYDTGSGIWSRAESPAGGRHYGQYHATWGQREAVSDYRQGNLYQITPASFRDDGEDTLVELTTRHLYAQYKRVRLHRLSLSMAKGESALPEGALIMLQVSKDEGRTWGTEQWRSFGAQGEYAPDRVYWLRLGTGRDFTFRLRISSPVPVVITGGDIEVEVSQH